MSLNTPTPQEPNITEMLASLSETAVTVVKAVMVLEMSGQHDAAVAFMAAMESVA